jgi:predicted nucleotidyltransferase
MALNLENVIEIVKNYADEVRQVMSVYKVFLYGSYAKGTANKYSDVDVCFILTELDEENWFIVMKQLFSLSAKYTLGIEPNIFEVSDIHNNNPFVEEVLRTGIEIK